MILYKIDNNFHLFKPGDKVIVIEKYNKSGTEVILESNGIVIESNHAYVETEHKRDILKYPGLGSHGYEKIFIKHYTNKTFKII